MGRTPCCSKEQGLNRGAWTAMEDQILTDYIKAHGQGKWRNIPTKAGLNRCGKSCRLRWLNYLRPDIKRGNITDDEEELIIRLHKLLGNRWSLIAGRLPGRTDNEIKNYWNTIIGKKLSNQPSPSPPPVRRSSSFPAAHDHPIPDIPIIKRSYSFTAQDPPPRPDYNATGPSQINDLALTKERFSQLAVSDRENSMMDLDMDRDFISDILNAPEFAQLNSDQPLTPLSFDFQSFAASDHLDWLINF